MNPTRELLDQANTELVTARKRIAQLEEALRWIRGECLFATSRPDGFDLRKHLGEISHKAHLALDGSVPETKDE